MTASPDGALELVVRGLRGDPEFLAAWFAAAPDQGTAARARLNLDPDQWLRLLLCRAPRADRFAEDVSTVASSLDLVPTALAAAIRETTALTALAVWTHVTGSEEDAGVWEGLLAAAHDRTTEQLGTELVAAGWLRHRADRFWSVIPNDTRQQLDLDTAIIWGAPLTVVALPELSPARARAWLLQRGVRIAASGRDRNLRGLLLAARGSGVVFLDAGLPSAARRFTLAHELGHFLLDYLDQRQRVLNEAPDLLDAVDGTRPPTAQERTRAILARVSIGLHTHLLDRDPQGEAAQDVEQAEDAASHFALELLAPWDLTLQVVEPLTDRRQPFDEVLAVVTDALTDRFLLPTREAKTRARTALDALSVSRGFFDR
jgi:hypothetical protein